MTMISRYFSLNEATTTTHRAWIGANQAHANRYIKHVITHARETMDFVRTALANPVHVNSWVRCQGLNNDVGGSDHSDHVVGPLESDISIERIGAADFTCPAFGSPYDVARHLASLQGFDFRQIIYEHTWVHVSSPRMVNGARERPLRQVLTLNPRGGYVPGIVLQGSL